jgi:hypothetical protein
MYTSFVHEFWLLKVVRQGSGSSDKSLPGAYGGEPAGVERRGHYRGLLNGRGILDLQ